MGWSTTVLLVVVTILTAALVWSRRTYVYWQRRRIKFVQPTHLLGNLKEVVKLQHSFATQLRNFYFDARFANEPLIGIYLFHQPALLLRDLELVRIVLVEDFVSFSNRWAKCDPHTDKLGALNMFFVRNPEWREIRTKLAPAFTNGKLKQMFQLMEEIGAELESYLQRLTTTTVAVEAGEAGESDEHDAAPIVQIKEICDLYTTDMIASIAFGYRTYGLRNSPSEIGAHVRQMMTLSFRRAFDFCVIFLLPRLVPVVRPKLFTPEHADFLRRTIRRVIEERERSGYMRNDLIEMLLTLRKESELNQDKSHFTHQHEYLAAQAAVFEFAGIETCSATMAFALYELAKHPAIQRRLRAEIATVFGGRGAEETIDYDRIANEMPYLGMVIDETLRKYPIVPFLERECTPINKKRFYSFRPHVECMARRGMPIFISNYAIHHDPKYWPDPERFEPERFSAENRKSHTPFSYLPFGAGPHNCIGMSIGLLQLRLGLVHFLRGHRVECCERTVASIRFDPKWALLANEGGIYVKIVKSS